MEDDKRFNLSEGTKRVLGFDGMIVGLLIGGLLIFIGLKGLYENVHLIDSPVLETLWVAVYLTMVVAYFDFKMPVFFYRSPFWSTFTIIFFCGHISLFFDSFAVILLLNAVPFTALAGTNERFNQFFVKAVCSFTALTVGGGFFLGELWGLPWFITNGLDNPLAGLPILLVLTPYAVVLAWVAAKFHPVKMKKVDMDRKQIVAAIEFAAALVLIVVSHSPFLCIGVLFFYSALCRSTTKLVENFSHEIVSGGQNALGLILVAVLIQWDGSATPLIQSLLQGKGMLVGAAISSPFAGAMAPAVKTLDAFYIGLSHLMLGAPTFVFSSLVTIMIFKHSVNFADLPGYMRPAATLLGGKRRGHVPEWALYSVTVFPMLLGLALCLYVANTTGLFLWGADVLGVTMPAPVATSVH